MWFHSITHPGHFDGDHPATLKKMSFPRWALKDKTADALYAEWQFFSFDPVRDDIEEFIGDVIQIATKLGYLERTQVMVIMGALSTVIHNITINIEGLNDLKEYIDKGF